MRDRDFDKLLDYCRDNMNYANLAYQGGFRRVLDYEEYNREGQYKQLFYVIYDFLNNNNIYISQITPPPFDIQNNTTMFNDWRKFINSGAITTPGYNLDSIILNLTPSCGGIRSGGGGWSPIAKILFSVVAKYLS